MRSHAIVLLAFFGALACRREAPPAEPSPAAEPAMWSELPPQPTRITAAEVCEHILGIMAREQGEAPPISAETVTQFRGECIKVMKVEQIKLGDEEFQREAECVLAVRDFEAMEACDTAERKGSAESEAICKHVLEILERELGTANSTAQEREQLLQECVTEADEERATMPPEKAAQQRDCIFAASTLAELERCDTDSP